MPSTQARSLDSCNGGREFLAIWLYADHKTLKYIYNLYFLVGHLLGHLVRRLTTWSDGQDFLVSARMTIWASGGMRSARHARVLSRGRDPSCGLPAPIPLGGIRSARRNNNREQFDR